MIQDIVHLGPLNGGVLVLSLLAGAAVIAWALRQLHHGEAVPLVPVAVALLVPVLFASFASTWQHEAAMSWAVGHPDLPMRQTLMAGVLERAILTQVVAGGITAVLGVVFTLGATLLTVRGERPRWLIGAVGGVLGVALVVVAAAGLSEGSTLLLAARVTLYALAAGVTAGALIAAHRRGPGMQLAVISSMMVPLIIVGTDLFLLGAVAFQRLVAIAQAEPALKQSLMNAALNVLDTLQTSGWISLTLAALLALLGPAVVWRRERPMAGATLVALAAVVLVAGVGLSVATGWAAPFRPVP